MKRGPQIKRRDREYPKRELTDYDRRGSTWPAEKLHWTGEPERYALCANRGIYILFADEPKKVTCTKCLRYLKETL